MAAEGNTECVGSHSGALRLCAHPAQVLAPPADQQTHSAQGLDMGLWSNNPDTGRGKASASTQGVREAWEAMSIVGLGQSNKGHGLDLALRLCIRPGFWCSTPPETLQPVGRSLWDKDTVILAALLTGHPLKAWTKGPKLQMCCWASSRPSSEHGL